MTSITDKIDNVDDTCADCLNFPGLENSIEVCQNSMSDHYKHALSGSHPACDEMNVEINVD